MERGPKMTEYINRENVIKALKENTTEMESDTYYPSNMGIPEEEIENIINEIPTEDVTPVVRCCQCKYLKTIISKENYCDIHSTKWDKFYVKTDDYCSYGERRDNK